MEWQIYVRETGAVLGNIEAPSRGAAILGAMLRGHDGGAIGVRAVTAELRELEDLRRKMAVFDDVANAWRGLSAERRAHVVEHIIMLRDRLTDDAPIDNSGRLAAPHARTVEGVTAALALLTGIEGMT